MKLFRKIIGALMVLVHRLTLPKAGSRDSEHQAEVEQQLGQYSLYQFSGCPFCIKVVRAMRRLNLPMELRDSSGNQQFRQELLEQGGRIKAPCLRIDKEDGSSEWMYESNDIIAFLNRQFPLLRG
ncbi:MAG: glutathione S-transferase N-terminal domain-containing protein [Motiliproteus sp.]